MPVRNRDSGVEIDSETRDLLKQARQHLRNGEPTNALRICDSLLTTTPRQPRAAAIRAHALIDLNRVDGTAAVFCGGVIRRPDRGDCHKGLARIAEIERRWHDARTHWTDALAARPKAIWAKVGLAGAALRAGRLEEARRQSALVLDVKPDHHRAARIQARALHALISRTPNRVEGHKLAARRAEKALRWDDAENHWRQLVEARPGNMSFRVSLALALERQGRMDEAEATLVAPMSTEPRPPAIGLALAQFAIRNRRWALTEDALSVAAQVPSDDPTDLIKNASLHAQSGQYEIALNLTRRYRNRHPTDHQGWFNELCLLRIVGTEKDRRLLLDKARSALVSAPGTLSLLLDLIGNFEEARDLRRASSESADPVTRLDLAKTYRRLGRLDAVHQLITNGLPESATDHRVWLSNVCELTGTTTAMLHDHVRRADPLFLKARIAEQIAEQARGQSPCLSHTKRIAICRTSFAGVGGAERSGVLAADVLTRHPSPFERVTVVAGQKHEFPNAQEDFSAHLVTAGVDVRWIPTGSRLPAIRRSDGIDRPEPWANLLSLLPGGTRRLAFDLFDTLTEIKPDAVIVWGVSSNFALTLGVAALMAGTKQVIFSPEAPAK